MYSSFLRLCLTVFVPYVTAQQSIFSIPFNELRVNHIPSVLSQTQMSAIASLSNITHMNEVLDKICIVRVVGTPGHDTVKQYLKDSMKNLGWTVESDIFHQAPPRSKSLKFENIIAKLNPNAKRYLTLACHYDSKYVREKNFVGATDSAVPCAQLLNLATVMKDKLKSAKKSDLSLMFIFFDGEEAFHEWGPNDSIYGAKHLADKWHRTKKNYGLDTNISDLERMDLLMLLDLIGAPDPTFYSYFQNTERWFKKLIQLEQELATLRKFERYSYTKEEQRYFQPYNVVANIEDDHIPFLRKGVPILHLIPSPFPTFWHTPEDRRSNIDMNTTENLNKIFRAFVASYLHLDI